MFKVVFRRFLSSSTGQAAFKNINSPPPAKIHWFFCKNTVISESHKTLNDEKLQNFKPGKWSPFKAQDSINIEKVFQNIEDAAHVDLKYLEHYDDKIETKLEKLCDYRQTTLQKFNYNYKRNITVGEPLKPYRNVPVNEDNLYQVNLKKFTLSAIYWDGPVYKVTRGIWFTNQVDPIDYHLAKNIEWGYQSIKPWLFESQNQEEISNTDWEIETSNGDKKLVYFFNDHEAYIIHNPENLNSFKKFLLKNFFGNPIFPGVDKITRGYNEDEGEKLIEAEKQKYKEDEKNRLIKDLKSTKGVTEIATLLSDELSKILSFEPNNEKVSNLITESMNNNKSSVQKESKIEHLVFCIHGIGQILGAKYENVNFIHTVNNLRNNLKKNSLDILNEPNPKIQVIPIIWRSLIDFNKLEDEAEEINNEDQEGLSGKEKLATLEDLTIKEIKPLRFLINNTLLDILLYYETPYKNQILIKVIEEINRAFRKYLIYNPDFDGKVSLVGHSLGSAIGYDILSLQKFNLDYKQISKNSNDKLTINKENEKLNNILNEKLIKSNDFLNNAEDLNKYQLDFNVDNYYSIGSPYGLFNLLKKKSIKSRKLLAYEKQIILSGEYDSDDLIPNIDFSSTSYPSCNNFFNIFDTCDPVAYRIEPLINKYFAKFETQELNYKELENSNPGFFESIIKDNDLIKTGQNFLNSYAGSSLKMFNEQFESFLNTIPSFPNNNDKGLQTFRPLKKVNPNEDTGEDFSFDDLDIVNTLHGKPIFKIFNEDFYNLESNDSNILKSQIELLSCNSNGRVDYCIPHNFSDILIINTLKSHTTYFENDHIAKFILNETLFKSGKRKDDGLINDPSKELNFKSKK